MSTLPDPRHAPDAAAPRPSIAVVIPVLDEERSLPSVLRDLPADLVDRVVVVDNGSTDRSAAVAREAGATVVEEPERGYGAACLRGIATVGDFDIVCFLDGDYSDYPEELRDVVAPVLAGRADMVIGSRMLNATSRAAIPPQARFGNRLSAVLLRLLFGIRCSDLGPFRAIRRTELARLGMRDRNYGWTVEMQVRAKLAGLRVEEIPVRYRERIGVSKVSGTVKGSILAGYKILKTIFAYRLFPPRIPRG